MRKTILIIAIAAFTTNAFSQEMMSKKGTPILPEAKDWAIGVELNSFLKICR